MENVELAVMPVIEQRRSPAVFDPAFTVDDACVHTLFEAARWSPSAGNSQPWRFIVGLRGDATFEAIEHALTRGNRRWAPAASLLAISLIQTKTLPGAAKEFIFEKTAAFDAGQASAYLSLQAHSMGLAAHQFIGFDVDEITRVFHISDEWAVMAGVAIGRAWLEAERDPNSTAVQALTARISEYDLEGNAERELKPRKRRPIDEAILRSGPSTTSQN